MFGIHRCDLNIIINKAIRDCKYLARHMPVFGNVHPIKLENVDIFFVTCVHDLYH